MSEANFMGGAVVVLPEEVVDGPLVVDVSVDGVCVGSEDIILMSPESSFSKSLAVTAPTRRRKVLRRGAH